MQTIFYLIHGNSLALGCEGLKVGENCIIHHYNLVRDLNHLFVQIKFGVYILIIILYGKMTADVYEMEGSHR
jgi:hypothetical protein